MKGTKGYTAYQILENVPPYPIYVINRKKIHSTLCFSCKKQINWPNSMLSAILFNISIKISRKWESLINFIYSEKVTKFCKIFLLLLTTVHIVKSKGKILKIFVAFSEYMNFKYLDKTLFHLKF